MDPVVALNNSPYYYFKPRMMRSIGASVPRTMHILSKVADMLEQVEGMVPHRFVPGIQLGVESGPAICSSSGAVRIRDFFSDRGVVPIVHVPDYIVPGTYLTHGFSNRILSLLKGPFDYDIRDFEKEVVRYIDAAQALECDTMVMHLPNGTDEDIAGTCEYLTGAVCEHARSLGIHIALENCNNSGSPFFGDLQNVFGVVDSLDSPYGFCFDYGHYLVDRDAHDIESLHRAAESASVHHVHINDCLGDRHLFLGERPEGIDERILERNEKVYVEDVLSRIDSAGKTFVLERNKSYSSAQLAGAVTRLLDVLGQRAQARR